MSVIYVHKADTGWIVAKDRLSPKLGAGMVRVAWSGGYTWSNVTGSERLFAGPTAAADAYEAAHGVRPYVPGAAIEPGPDLLDLLPASTVKESA